MNGNKEKCSDSGTDSSGKLNERFLPAHSIDLHMHTTASDGMISPGDIVQKAAERKLSAIAITDHDTVAGVAAASERGESLGLKVVPGAEFSASFTPVMHILGLYIDIENDRLLRELHQLTKSRMRLIAKSIKAANIYGMKVDPQQLLKKGKAITIVNLREYLIKYKMMEPGCPLDIQLSEILGEWKNCLPSPERCISLIHSCGGLAFLAHPILLHRTNEELVQLLKQLKEDGLDGIEVIHPAHSHHDQTRLIEWANELGLLCSGGSDYHGETDHYAGRKDMPEMFERFVPYSYLETITDSIIKE